MDDEQLQKVAFLYGRNAEKRRRTYASTDEEAYREYDALCLSLWRELQENDAVEDNGILKAEYVLSMESGRDSVVEY